MRTRQRHLKPKSIGAFIALDSRYINQSNNTVVSSWNDISGNSNNATQLLPNFQPVFITNILSGNGVVRFDGENDYLQSPTITKTQPYTCFVISFPRVYIGGYNSFFDDTSGGCTPIIAPQLGVSKHVMFAGTNFSSINATLNFWFLGSYVFNTTNSKITINGGDTGTGNAGSLNLNGIFILGANYNLSRPYNNDTAFAMVCESAFSDSLRKKVEKSAAYSFKLTCS
jgi:hypothetical protein